MSMNINDIAMSMTCFPCISEKLSLVIVYLGLYYIDLGRYDYVGLL